MPYKVRYTHSLNDLLERSTLGSSLPTMMGALLPTGLMYSGISIESPLFYVICLGLLGCFVFVLLLRKRRIKRTIPEHHLEIRDGVLHTFLEEEAIAKADLAELKPALSTEYIRTAASYFMKIPYFRLSLTTDALGRQDFFFLVDGDYHLAQTHKLLGDYRVQDEAQENSRRLAPAAR